MDEIRSIDREIAEHEREEEEERQDEINMGVEIAQALQDEEELEVNSKQP